MTSFVEPPFWSVSARRSRLPHFGIVQVTKPAGEPVSLTLAKNWLRQTDTVDDTLIAGLIQAARMTVEHDTGLSLMPQTVDVTLDGFPWDDIVLPVAPLASVTSITTTDLDGTASVLAASNYQVDTASMPPRIGRTNGGVWPSGLRYMAPIAIRCVVGYVDAAAVPTPLMIALQIQVQILYDAARSGEAAALATLQATYAALIGQYCLGGMA